MCTTLDILCSLHFLRGKCTSNLLVSYYLVSTYVIEKLGPSKKFTQPQVLSEKVSENGHLNMYIYCDYYYIVLLYYINTTTHRFNFLSDARWRFKQIWRYFIGNTLIYLMHIILNTRRINNMLFFKGLGKTKIVHIFHHFA